MHHYLRAAFLLMLLAWQSPAWALGLGEMTVESFLNQPLKARINLITQPGDDVASLSVQLAGADDYALIGGSRDAISVPLNFRVVGEAGNAQIRVSSEVPVRDPVVRLLIEVNWANGRLLREYTVFLDPPTVPSSAPPPVTTAPAPDPEPESPATPITRPAAPEPVVEEPPPATFADEFADVPDDAQAAETADAEVASSVSEDTSAESTDLDGDEYGPVQSGETLWSIASEYGRGSGLSTNQIMLAIQRANPSAFNRGNINSLKRGAILRMPAEEEITSLSVAEATAQVIAQEEEYELQRLGFASAPPTVADEAVAPAPEPEPAPVADEDDMAGRLELIPPEETDTPEAEEDAVAPGEAVADDAAEDEAALDEEELANIELENEYRQAEAEAEAEAETAAAEAEEAAETIAPATVEDDTLAEMEQRLREQRTAARSDDGGWWTNPWLWIIAVLILAALAVVAWRIRSSSGEPQRVPLDSDGASVEGLRSEAEDVLRTLSDELADAPPQEAPEDATEEPPKPDGEGVGVAGLRAAPDEDIVSEELVGDDPEVKLDLARAYTAMGDKEAARSMLEEVIEQGDEAQQKEARNMLDEL